MKQKISILGSTGSIGLQSLDIISKTKNSFIIYLLSANKNQNEICKQIIKYKPKYFVISNYDIFKRIKKKFKNNKTKIINNIENIKVKKNDTYCLPGIVV